MPNKVKKLFSTFLALETAVILLFLPNLYMELTNPAKINSWYESVMREELGGLPAESAFYKLSRHGFRVASIGPAEGNGERVVLEPPYDQGLIAFFRVRIPFKYVVETNSIGVVVSYGISK